MRDSESRSLETTNQEKLLLRFLKRFSLSFIPNRLFPFFGIPYPFPALTSSMFSGFFILCDVYA
jgi:hypothetical protein